MKKTSKMGDNYELARTAEEGRTGNRWNLIAPVLSQAHSKPGVEAQRSKTKSKGEIQCWKFGGMAVACPVRKNSAPSSQQLAGNGSYPRSGQTAHAVILQTGWQGSSGAAGHRKRDLHIVRANLVDPTKHTQQTVEVKCVHSNIIAYPTATIDLEIDCWQRRIVVALVLKRCQCCYLERQWPSNSRVEEPGHHQGSEQTGAARGAG